MAGNAAAKDMQQFALIEADLIKVVGRDTPERIFVICGSEKLAKTKAFAAFKSSHDAFLQSYRAGNFDKASGKAQALHKQAEAYNVQGYYRTMLARLDIYKQNPPENWDGIFEAKSK